MKRPPIRERVVRALALQPMTIRTVARCLSVTQQSANEAMNRMCRRGDIRRHGWERRKGRAAQLFEVLA